MLMRFTFQVVGGSNRTKCKGAGIFLFLRHVFIDPLCKFSCAQYEKPSGQRIQRARVSNLFDSNKAPYFSNYVK